jgi:3-oxoacyl-[acyl-carrier protein] reductase
MRLQDKVAIITGAARGIGKAIAVRFAAEGAKVVAADIEGSAVESLAAGLNEKGLSAAGFKADVAGIKEVEELFAKTIKRFGRVDILVNCAGLRRDVPFYKMTAEEWDSVIGVQLKGAFSCCRTAQKYMTAQNYGKIINFSSPLPPGAGNEGSAGYAAATSGIGGFTEALARELGPFGINVNCIAPDFIDTEMTRDAARRAGMYLADFKKLILPQIPLRRLGSPEDIAGAALFLASEDSAFVTGQTIRVRGGP